MKKMRTYSDFVSESIRDKMTPISQEDKDELMKHIAGKVAKELVKLNKSGLGISGIVKYDEAYDFVVSKMDMIEMLVDEYGCTDPYKIAINIQYDKKLYGYRNKTDEGVRDKMTPKSVEEIIDCLPTDMGEIYRKSKEHGWNIEINGYGINTYLILNFKYFKITVMRHAKELFANITIWLSPLATSYDIPLDLSGIITNFEQLKSKIDKLLNIEILKESLRDKMTPKSKDDIKNVIKDIPKDKMFLAFCKAALRDHLDVFLDMGVDINITDDYGNTALHELCWMDGVDNVVKKLLDLGADPNMINQRGETPLIISVINTNIPVLKILLKCEKLKPYEHRQIYTAIDLTVKDEDIRKILIDYELNQPLSESIRDKMTPKPKEETKEILEDILRKLAFELSSTTMRQWTKMFSYEIAYKYVKSHESFVEQWVADNGYNSNDIEELAKEMIIYFGRVVNEGIRDKMTPKSKEDILKDLENINRESIEEELLEQFEEFSGGNEDRFVFFIRDKVAKDIMNRLQYEFNITLDGATDKYDVVRATLILLTKEELIKTYKIMNQMNEGIRDMMTPKSKEDIINSLKSSEINKKGIKNLLGRSCLHGDYEQAKIILDYAGDRIDYMAMIDCFKAAIVSKNPELIELLLDHGADVTQLTELPYAARIQIGGLKRVENWIKKYNKVYKDKINEGIRDKMIPKSDEEINKGKQDIIKYINNIVKINGGVSMEGLQLGAENYIVYNTENITFDHDEETMGDDVVHTIQAFLEDCAEVVAVDMETDETVGSYTVDYEDMEPEILIQIKEMLEFGVNSGHIDGE